jgi:hypothetical protein
MIIYTLIFNICQNIYVNENDNFKKEGDINMNNFKKIVLPVLLSLSLIIVLVACNKDEITVYKAMMKMNDIKSVETDTQISFRLGYENSDENVMERVKTILNNLKLNTKTKYIKENDSVYNLGSDVEVDMGDLAIQFSYWQNADLKTDMPVLKQIYKVPTVVKSFLPNDFSKKDYFVMDFEKLYEESDILDSDAFTNIVSISEELNIKFKDLLNAYSESFNPKIKCITKKHIVNSAQVYELRFDDTSFKEFIKYVVNDYIENPKTREITREFILSISELLSVYNDDLNMYDEDFENYIDEFETNINEFKDGFDDFFDKINDIIIIGDKGIVVDYHITKNGFITKMNGNIDIVFDYKAIREAFGIPEDSFSNFNNSHITLGIDFVNTNNNINRVTNLKMPVLTEDNSFGFDDIYKTYDYETDYEIFADEDTEEDDGFKIFVDNYKRYSEIEPQFIDGVLYLPAVEFIEEVIYGYTQEEPDSGYILSFTGLSIVRFGPDDSIVRTKDGNYELKYSPVYIDDILCIPAETFLEALGFKVEWEPENTKLNIMYNYEF